MELQTRSEVLSRSDSSSVPLSPPGDGTRAETFRFRRDELTQEGVLFTRADDRTEIMKVDLGDIQGSTPIRSLLESLDATKDAGDRALLNLTRTALKHVRVVRHGDPVPAEVTSGQPSWTPTEDAVSRAAGKLVRGLAAGYGTPDRTGLRTVAGYTGIDDLGRRIVAALGPEGVEAIKSKLSTDFDDLELQLAEATLTLARVDGLQVGTSLLQRTVGEIAYMAAEKRGTQPGYLMREIGLLLRNAGAWGAKSAMGAEAMISRLRALVVDPAFVEDTVWPRIRALHSFVLDVEPVILKWRGVEMSKDGSVRMGDLEALLRLAHQRFAEFDETLYFDRKPPAPLTGFAEAG
jgi:hypothetical protein